MKIEEVNLEVFWNMVICLTDESTRAFNALQETAKDDDKTAAYHRRVYARAVFAVFDAAIYYMTYYAYIHQNLPDDHLFLPEELERLQNSFDFDEDKDDFVTAFSKQKWLEQIRFTLYAFAKVHELEFVPQIFEKRSEWVLIRGIAEIRHWIRFPRSVEELEIHEDRIETLAVGLTFFVKTMADLMNAAVMNYQENYPQFLTKNEEIQENEDQIM